MLYFSIHRHGLPFASFGCRLLFVLTFATSLISQAAPFTAFNDHIPGLGTSSNVTTFGPSQSGSLKDWTSGAILTVQVSVTTSAAVANTIQGHPFYGSPASVVFDGIVDLAGYPFPALEMSSAASFVTYTFTGLDPAKEYNFQGTAIRGNINYGNRWTLFEITNAASFNSRHSPGAVTSAQIGSLTSAQVAINTGNNAQGVLAWWEHIRPNANGTFGVISRRYSGSLPGGATANGTVAYGLTGFRLEEGPVYSGHTNPPPQNLGHSDGGINGISTVWIVVMENSDWATIKGSTNCPYINNVLLPQSAYCERYYNPPGLHPSLPNYLWMLTGTNFNIQDDSLPSVNHQSTTNTLFHQLEAAGISWQCYAEGIPGNTCPDLIAGDYAPRHVPFLYFDSVRTNLTNCTGHIRPYPEMVTALANGTLARFNFLVPNRTNDMHDPVTDRPAAIRQGDAWLAAEMPRILNSAAYEAGGLVVIAFDEGEGSTGDGPVGAILLSPRVKGPGYASTNFYDHSSLLRTLQDIYNVRPYLGASVYANDMSDLFKTITISRVTSGPVNLTLTTTNLLPLHTNYLLFSTSPAGPWQPMRTNVTSGTGQTVSIERGNTAGFYQVRELP
jgi:hypothetical protein